VIAGVRGRELEEAGSLGVAGTLAIDDDEAIKKFRMVDAIADIVGGDIAAKLIAKIKPGVPSGTPLCCLRARRRKIRPSGLPVCLQSLIPPRSVSLRMIRVMANSFFPLGGECS